MTVENKLHHWKINDVEELLDADFETDCELYNSVTVENSYYDLWWEVVVIFNGSKSELCDWISLQLKLLTPEKRVNLNFKIWMVTKNGTKIRMNYDSLLEIEDTSSFFIPEFINKDGLFLNFDEYISRNSLTLIYEFDIDSIDVISRPKKARIMADYDDDNFWTYFYDDITRLCAEPIESTDRPDSTKPSVNAIPSVGAIPSARAIPSVSKIPSVIKIPTVSAIFSGSGISSISTKPSVSGISSVSAIPSVSGISSISTKPSVSGISSISTKPSVSGISSVNAKPSVSGISSVNAKPSVSGIPSVSAIPSVSGISSASTKPSVSTIPR